MNKIKGGRPGQIIVDLKYTAKTQPSLPKKRSFPWLLFLAALFCSWFVWQSLVPQLPEIGGAPKLYSNQCRQDLRSTFLKAIEEAKSSIHLVMFGLTDRPVLGLLAKKIKENISTTIYYDTSGSGKMAPFLHGANLHGIKHSSLMHQKILVIDQEKVFIGSANMTTASLKMHDNLVVGLCSPSIAKFLEQHEPYSSGYIRSMVGGQDVELWLLPDPRGHALGELKKKIRSAKQSIRIALFTLTHPGLVDEIISAAKKNVSVSLVIDMHAGLGASAKAIETLKKGGVAVRLSRGIQLMHHKFIYIDEKTLITGSANWTKAAFYKNSDCVLALHNLNAEQKRFMNRLWHAIETASQ